MILEKNIYSAAAVPLSLPVLSTLWRVADAVAELLSNFLGGAPEWWIESTASLGRLPVLSPFLAGNWDFHLLKQKVNKHRSATELCCLHWQIWAWDFLLAYNQWKMDYSNQFFHQTS